MSKIKDVILDAQEMGITFNSNEDMFQYFAQLRMDVTDTSEKVFDRIVKELGEY